MEEEFRVADKTLSQARLDHTMPAIAGNGLILINLLPGPKGVMIRPWSTLLGRSLPMS